MAQQSNPDDDASRPALQCSRRIDFSKIKEKTSFKTELNKEITYFLTYALNPAFHDNTHHLDNLTEWLLTQKARETHLCMRFICNDFFTQCSEGSSHIGISWDLNQSKVVCTNLLRDCHQTVDQFFIPSAENPYPVMHELMPMTLESNLARKDRSTHFEKTRALHIRQSQYANPLSARFIEFFSAFVDKITFFLKSPL